MGHKVNPHGLRVGVIKDWSSKWFVDKNEFAKNIGEDHKIREYLKKTLYAAGVPEIDIERSNTKIRITVHCAKPGILIGKGGTEIEKHRKAVEELIGKPVLLNCVEIRQNQVDLNAQLVAENIAAQLEKRVAFRRALKQSIQRTMRAGAKGIRTQVSGRLNGAEIARTERYYEGTVPLQTLRADIDYGFAEAATTYGRIGIKIWIYKGEVLPAAKKAPKAAKEGAVR